VNPSGSPTTSLIYPFFLICRALLVLKCGSQTKEKKSNWGFLGNLVFIGG
jgi:hypothetical protein